MTAMQIAIDGPAGAGKSTAAKAVAKELGYLYIDTGAMYRAVALMAMRRHIDEGQIQQLIDLTKDLDISLRQMEDGYYVFADGEDVTKDIRRPEVGNLASAISAIAEIRKLLVKKQQDLAAHTPVVMDGRDIGTVVLPKAKCKIFLTADSAIRAQRRVLELKERGIEADPQQVEADIIKRDLKDSSRAASPLKKADDAVLLDNSHLSVEEVVAEILRIAKER